MDKELNKNLKNDGEGSESDMNKSADSSYKDLDRSPSYYSQSVEETNTFKNLNRLVLVMVIFDLYYGYFYIFLYSTHPTAIAIHKFDKLARIV